MSNKLPIAYFRSSSYNQWDMCEQSYTLSYVLGIPQDTNKKAEAGTVTHKVMECLAAAKKALQDGKNTFEDDIMGVVTFDEAQLNSDEFVEYLFAKSYDHYTKRSIHTYVEKERIEYLKTTFKALRVTNGAFDPRKRDIVQPELHFDFTINEDWARYEFEDAAGNKVEGQLALKGTIDLVTKVTDTIYESTDWKTGQRIDWASNKPWPYNIKSFDKLMVDPQLRIYHYAIHTLYPHLEQVIPTIYFIEDRGTRAKPVPGGAFTMPYSKDEIPRTIEMIRRRFETIKNTSRPLLNRSWRCDRFCHFGRTAHSSGEIDPNTGRPHTICSYIAKRIREDGLRKVIAEETHGKHSIGNYQAPGA